MRVLSPILAHVDQSRLAAICAKFNVVWLAVFGSVARGEEHAESDLDVLVEFDPAASASYFTLEDLTDSLAEIFPGTTIDLGTKRQLSPFIRERALDEAVVLYAR